MGLGLWGDVMGRINVKRYRPRMETQSKFRRDCRISFTTLETGETVKRGCGGSGLVPYNVGWRCLYCGNFVYRAKITVRQMWFHFKVAREYWRPMSRQNVNFINGIPVSGAIDSLPRFLLRDLDETLPPKWFPYYLLYDESQFKRYLEKERDGKNI